MSNRMGWAMDFQEWARRVDELVVSDSPELEYACDIKHPSADGPEFRGENSDGMTWSNIGRFVSTHAMRDRVRALGLQAVGPVPFGMSSEAFIEQHRQFEFEQYFPLDELGAQRAAVSVRAYLTFAEINKKQ